MRLAVWSGPRNISTALLRSWENRPDTPLVVDEPLYAHYLHATGSDHPGLTVIAAGDSDWRSVVATLLGPVEPGLRVFYQKHGPPPAARHGPGLISGLRNVLLIRDPREVVASYARTRRDPSVADLGLPRQVALYDELWRRAHPRRCSTPPMSSAARSPCACAVRPRGVGFTDRMLAWPPGPGPPATGCGAHQVRLGVGVDGLGVPPRRPHLDGRAAAVAGACGPLYQRLHRGGGCCEEALRTQARLLVGQGPHAAAVRLGGRQRPPWPARPRCCARTPR